VAELLSERCPVPVLRHGMEDQFGRSGKASEVLSYYAFTPEALAEKAKRILRA
jgi:transketolase